MKSAIYILNTGISLYSCTKCDINDQFLFSSFCQSLFPLSQKKYTTSANNAIFGSPILLHI